MIEIILFILILAEYTALTKGAVKLNRAEQHVVDNYIWKTSVEDNETENLLGSSEGEELVASPTANLDEPAQQGSIHSNMTDLGEGVDIDLRDLL